MVELFYPLIVFAYKCVLIILSPFNSKAKEALAGRKGWLDKLKKDTGSKSELIWIHCASVGEFEDVRVLIDKIREQKMGEVYLTFQSPTGVNKIKSYPGVLSIGYLPYDTLRNVRSFLKVLRPSKAIFSRYELWLFYLKTLKINATPVYLTGFRVTSANKYFSPVFRVFYKKCFDCFSMVFCEDEQTKSLFQKHFPKVITEVTGNPRIDRVYQIGKTPRPDLDNIFKRSLYPIVILGSIEPSDYSVCAAAINSVSEKSHWIITPHEVDEASLKTVEKQFGRRCIRMSELTIGGDLPEFLIVDSVGNLAQLYKYASLAVVGGGFARKGVHNILEPAVHGVPTTCGPNHRNYSDVLQLLDAGLLTIHHNEIELGHWFNHNLNTSNEELCTRLKSYINQRIGATEKHYKAIFYHEIL